MWIVFCSFSAEFYGWIDESYVGQSQIDNITITTTKGGSVILECSPNTTESLSHLTPTWPHLSSLKSSSVLSSGNVLLWNVEQEVQQECYWALRPESKMRSFTVVIATGKETMLYCVAVHTYFVCILQGTSLLLGWLQSCDVLCVPHSQYCTFISAQ